MGNVLDSQVNPQAEARFGNLVSSYLRTGEAATEEAKLAAEGKVIHYPTEALAYFTRDGKHGEDFDVIKEAVDGIPNSGVFEHEIVDEATGNMNWNREVVGIVIAKHNGHRFKGRAAKFPQTTLWISYKRPVTTTAKGTLVGGDISLMKITADSKEESGRQKWTQMNTQMMKLPLLQAVRIAYELKPRVNDPNVDDKAPIRIEEIQFKAEEHVSGQQATGKRKSH